MIDLLFEILNKIILKKISIQYYPQLLRLKYNKEEYEDLLKLGPEDFLKRWFNFHLNKAGCENVLINLSDDIKDSEKYIILFNQLSPNICDKSALEILDLGERARKVIKYAQNIGVKVNIKNEDI